MGEEEGGEERGKEFRTAKGTKAIHMDTQEQFTWTRRGSGCVLGHL